jgi:hypothetical protein
MKYLGIFSRVDWQIAAFGFLCLNFVAGNMKVLGLCGTSGNIYHSTWGQMSHIKVPYFLGQLMIN